MPALSAAQNKTITWSKFTLIGSVLLFVFSLFTLLVAIHADRQFHHNNQDQGFNARHGHGGGHHGHGHHNMDAPCRLHHFAVLGLVTSLTGIWASFTHRRGCALFFLILVLISEISVLGFISHANAKAVDRCSAAAISTTTSARSVVIQTADVKIGDGKPVMVQEAVVYGAQTVQFDAPKLEDCLNHVRHAAVLASVIVGVIACSLACCGSRFSNAILEEQNELEAEEKNSTACVVNSCEVIELTQQQQQQQQPVVAILVPSQDFLVAKEQPQQVL